MFLQQPPNASNGLRALVVTATSGLCQYIPNDISKEARSFLEKCLQPDPEKRAQIDDLLTVFMPNYPFLLSHYFISTTSFLKLTCKKDLLRL